MTSATSPRRTLRIAMNGVTGRMGYRQHLLRSILPLRDAGLVLEDGTRVAEFYAQNGIDADVQPFFPDIPARMSEAQLVICRSGASTIARRSGESSSSPSTASAAATFRSVSSSAFSARALIHWRYGFRVRVHLSLHVHVCNSMTLCMNSFSADMS